VRYGRLAGILLGVGGAWLLVHAVGTVVVVSYGAIAMACLCAAAGIIFGLYPARNTALMRPGEAPSLP